MQPDVTEFIDFYGRPIGGVVRRILAHRIRARWRRLTGSTLVGLGFATPYLGSFRGETERLAALMPATQGAMIWPPQGPVMSVVVEERQLPLPDNSVDHFLAVHALEMSGDLRAVLREIWRVLKPDGRLLIIVPNRASMWARLDTTPFGHGRPFSVAQLERLLADALLTPIEWGMALYMPPVDRNLFVRSALTLERVGAKVSRAFGGVIIVEARKELIAPSGTAVAAKGLKVLVPSRGTTFSSVEHIAGDKSPAAGSDRSRSSG